MSNWVIRSYRVNLMGIIEDVISIVFCLAALKNLAQTISHIIFSSLGTMCFDVKRNFIPKLIYLAPASSQTWCLQMLSFFLVTKHWPVIFVKEHITLPRFKCLFVQMSHKSKSKQALPFCV